MDIRSFQGWRYSSADGDISRFIAPPYDVLSQADKNALLAGDEYNIVAVDLPHVPPKQVGPDEVYQAASDRLDEWKSSHLLRQDDKPAIYAYRQAYSWAGLTHTRHMMICRVRATELGRDVIPHEKTFAGPKADRLKLTEYTRMQLSPIFGFYNDPGGGVATTLQSATDKQPDCTGSLNGVTEKLWVVFDENIIDSIAYALCDEPVFVADGHHRYTTALNYRDSLGEIAPDHPANFVMFVLVAMDDPGLIVLPTHRIIRGLKDFSLEEFIASTSDIMDYEPVRLTCDDAVDADTLLKPFGRTSMAFIGRGSAFVGRLKDTYTMTELAPDKIDTWRELDVVILHKLLIDKGLSDLWTDETSLDYTIDGPAALSAVESGQGDLAVLLQGAPIQAVREIALSGAVMPHKSTYFYPKVATGMVLYEVGGKCS
ncbi:MAG: DUF1015 domain-containing protein [Planctomycetota bacterium]|nr:DUF1015 domain-containing protein [Planctomycetota bacterium]